MSRGVAPMNIRRMGEGGESRLPTTTAMETRADVLPIGLPSIDPIFRNRYGERNSTPSTTTLQRQTRGSVHVMGEGELVTHSTFHASTTSARADRAMVVVVGNAGDQGFIEIHDRERGEVLTAYLGAEAFHELAQAVNSAADRAGRRDQ